MKKIPTLFERDWNGDKSRVVDQVHPGCEWVLAGEGVPTRKIDGTSCLVRDGKLYRRRELREGDAMPATFELADKDPETRKTVGWMLVGAGPADMWHREAFAAGVEGDGTYELVGPKVQGNPEGMTTHALIKHGAGLAGTLEPFTLTFDGIRIYLESHDMEGVVWHHPDGRMAKIKARDFGIKRIGGA